MGAKRGSRDVACLCALLSMRARPSHTYSTSCPSPCACLSLDYEALPGRGGDPCLIHGLISSWFSGSLLLRRSSVCLFERQGGEDRGWSGQTKKCTRALKGLGKVRRVCEFEGGSKTSKFCSLSHTRTSLQPVTASLIPVLLSSYQERRSVPFLLTPWPRNEAWSNLRPPMVAVSLKPSTLLHQTP